MAYTYDYPMPSVTADCVVLTNTKTPKVLLIKRGSEPYKDFWALPGGYMEINETTEECAIRELKEETGIDVNILYNVGTYSKVDRDPRERVISIGYLAILESEVEATGQDDAVDAKWFDTDKLPDLAFDHDLIIKDAIRNFWHVIETEREVKKCLEDRLYFYNNYVVEVDKDGNTVPRVLNAFKDSVVYRLSEIMQKMLNTETTA